LHRFRKERRSPRACFERGDITHFITNCPKQNDSSDKCNGKKKYCLGDKKKKKKKKFQKMMSHVCAALSDLDISNDDSSSS
jgi:hypothetical protein